MTGAGPGYKTVVTLVEKNPAYDEQRAREAADRHGPYEPVYRVSPTLETRVLEVVLTPEEYEAINQAVMATWK